MVVLLGLLILMVSVAILSGIIIGVMTYTGSDISEDEKKPVYTFLHSIKGKIIIAVILLFYTFCITGFILLIS